MKEYRTYRLKDKYNRLVSKVLKKISKVASRMELQMKSQMFKWKTLYSF